ncbi:sodium/glucose cotransporter 4-like isoform X3 [Biomphalaria glabrata]|uniref:Sodium/glucose cotransporter 4-like isoform X3 n=1 Tax=Biomphalaria glabrata TaxID=6526 RepID=A0A9W3B6Y9_BIOGL|nr:sodium/glucose cotransporter 4-like isoform X3 [Biomphalaria glabrata]
MTEELEGGDYAAIAIYFCLVLAVGLWSTCRPNRNNAAGYFLAGKDMHWFPVGASIFASNVGAPMFIGLAGTAAANGFSCAIYEWHAVYLLIALGWVFVPVYVSSGAFTMPEYLKKRFGGVRLRIFLTVFSLFNYVLIKISSEIFSGAIFLRQILGWNMYACIGMILAVTAIYTVAGGLTAVIYTDTLQTIILIIGAVVLFAITLVDVGGWNEFLAHYAYAASNLTLSDPVNYSCGMPRKDYMHVWRDAKTGDIPWPGAIIGLTTIGLTVWCNDQIMVQRCLSAKNISHNKGGAVFAAALKIFPFFLWIVPGMISRVLFPDEIACADPEACKQICGNAAGCSNIAYPLLVLRKMPIGLRGIMLSALLAALMSTLTSIFNSASSMVTMDLWRRFRRRAPQHELMIVGRVCVLVLIGGAFWGLVISTIVGLTRMVLEFVYTAPNCGSFEEDTRPAILKEVHFLHFAIILSGISILSTVIISLFTVRRSPEKLRRVTWWTRNDPLDPEETESEDDYGVQDVNEETQKVERVASVKKRNIGRLVYNWLCGIDNKPKQRTLTLEDKILIKKKMTDIGENPRAKFVSAVAAIAVAAVTTFLLGLFA